MIFKENNLGGMLHTVFGSSNTLAVMTCYPNRFKSWELPQCSRGYWTKESGICATKWLVEEVLKVDVGTYEIKRSDFTDNNLSGMLRSFYNNDFRRA